MNKYKICVYAICKNEEKFVDSWVESMSEADEIVVLDTGSNDDTVKKLKTHSNVKVFETKITPWRFDVARNESLKYISNDIDFCCCVDLDERFEKGWRALLEKHLNEDVEIVNYRYTWNFNNDGTEGIVFFAGKIHKNHHFKWIHPVHEILSPLSPKYSNQITIPALQLNHYADSTKSRSNYLPLLEISVQEDPTSDRNVHYLGREYYFYKKFYQAIDTLKRHLKMPNSNWAEERSASCRYIAHSYLRLNQTKNAIKYFKRAIIESPTSREPYFELAKYYFSKNKYFETLQTLLPALNIVDRQYNYISQPDCWNSCIYDTLALSFYNLKDYLNAIKYGQIALSYSPNDNRLKNNLDFYILSFNKNFNND